jgi:hypothetical protein
VWQGAFQELVEEETSEVRLELGCMIMDEYLKGIDTVKTGRGEIIYVKKKEEDVCGS